MIQERGTSPCVLILSLFLFSVISFSAGCGSSSPVTLTISPQTAAIGTGQSTQFTATVSRGTVTWTASAGTIDSTGNYTAPSATQSMTVTVTATSMQDSTKSASATVNVVAPGQVAATANVQVASYTVSPAAPGNVSVQFGTDTNYGLTTWTQPVPTGGGAVSLFVAGMKGNTLVPHERCGAVRRRLAIHGPGPHVHNRRVPSSTSAGDNDNHDAGNDTAERRGAVGFGRGARPFSVVVY